MADKKSSIISILDLYFSICSAIVTENSSDYKKLSPDFIAARNQVLSVEKYLNLPSWVKHSGTPSLIKSHVGLNVESGSGSWERRRNYLQSQREKIIEDLDKNFTSDLKRVVAQSLDNTALSDKNFSQQMADAFKAAAGGISSTPSSNKTFSQQMADAYKAAAGGIESSTSFDKRMAEAFKAATAGVDHHPLSSRTEAINAKVIHNEEERLGMTNYGSNNAKMKKKVFIVHGHDELLKSQLHVFLSQEGYEPIILHEQVNKGATIIEKLEKNIDNVSFAVILYTPCDEGRSVKEPDLKPRSRQNVVFEHGYLICKLGREKVAALKSDGVEIPGDLSGLITISASNWKYDLLKEIKAAIG